MGSTPPSFNKVGHTGCRWAWTREKKLWQGMIETLLIAKRVPRGLGRVDVRAELWFTTKRGRDAGNYRTLLEKCVGDALVNGRWLADDTPQHFSFGAVEFMLGEAPQTDLILAVTPLGLTRCDQASHPTPPQAPDQGTTAPPRRFRRPPRG